MLCRPRSLARVFSSEQIGMLPDNELSDIAAENYSTSSARNELRYKLERLEKALSIAEPQRM